MAFYIKVTREVADALGVTALRNQTAGETIFDRAARVGGAALTPQAAKAETDGTADYPAEVHTPEEYRRDEPTLLPELPEEGGDA